MSHVLFLGDFLRMVCALEMGNSHMSCSCEDNVEVVVDRLEVGEVGIHIHRMGDVHMVVVEVDNHMLLVVVVMGIHIVLGMAYGVEDMQEVGMLHVGMLLVVWCKDQPRAGPISSLVCLPYPHS